MDAAHERQLDELYRASRAHDEATADRADRFLNITPETGEFLRALAVAMNARLLLELGTSNGYSTLWLAHACAITGGQVVTVERHDWKRELAATHLARAGLAALVEHRGGEIRDLLPASRSPTSYSSTAIARSTSTGRRSSGAACGRAG